MRNQSFIDLEDYGTGPSCARVYVQLDIHTHVNYEVVLIDRESCREVLESELSPRDLKNLNAYVRGRVRDWISDQGDVA
jgi:hypothetical protein